MIRIRRVLAPNPGPFTLEGTNTWIVGERPSLVIDPGPDDAGHLLTVADEAEPLEAILLTHRHPDHAPGAGRLSAATGAPVYALRPEGDERPIRHNQVLEMGGLAVRAIHTPGHTSDHLVFLLDSDGAMFTGDTILGRGTSVVDPPDGDMAAYVRSLGELLALRPRVIYPGHGPVVFDATGRIEAYLSHREQREAQVLEALSEGRSSPEEMVPGIYGGDVPEAMFPHAARSVLAHLLKLEREGRAARTGRLSDNRFVVVREAPCVRCGRPARVGSSLCRRCSLDALQEGPG
ncbi:MAG TPA: MBL fold metallo-hydrolase [Actinomycetota bacterium]